MSLNPQYLVMYSEELQRQRMREAQKERLIRQVTKQELSLLTKILVILRARWSDLWDRGSHKYPPVSRMPKNSPSV